MPGPNILVSIGVPTYNRAHILKGLLENLEEVTREIRHEVEIVISDNASTDSTRDVCAEFARGFAGQFVYWRNDRNEGVSRNLVGLFYKCRGRFFLFMGDDDRLIKNGFLALVSILRDRDPAAVIQVRQDHPAGAVPLRDALSYLFYDYGNAYKGCVDRSAAKDAIDRRNLRSMVEQIVWPQTVMGFLAMIDLNPRRPVYAAPFEIGSSELHESLNIKTFAYFKRSMIDLIRAAAIVDEHLGKAVALRRVISMSSRFFVGNLLGLATCIVTEKVRLADRWSLVREMSRYGGAKGRLFAIPATVLLVEPIAFAAVVGSRLVRGRGGVIDSVRFIARISESKKAASASRPGVRYQNYFD